MASNYVEWYLQLYNARTDLPIDDDTGVYNVLVEDDPSEVTIYSDENGTSGSNPGTMTNGIIRFFTASSRTAVDISVLTANGHAFFLESVSQSQHRVYVLSERMEQTLIMPYQLVGASEVIVDTGFDVLANMMVRDVFLRVTTLGTVGVIDVGTSTDSDGFVDGVTVDTTGFYCISEVANSANGPGDLLCTDTTNGGTVGRKFHVRANSTSGANIVYTNTTSTSAQGEGYIYMTYYRLPA